MDIHAAGDEADLGSAARQAGWQLGLLAALGLLNVGSQPGRLILVALVVSFAAMAVALQFTPARVWGPCTIIVLTIVLFVCLGLWTWSAGDLAMAAAPGFIFAFVWMGLHQRVRTILFFLLPATVTYWLALRLAGIPPEEAGSALALIPVAALVGVVIASVVGEARRAKVAIKAEERWRAAIMATLAHDVRSPLTSIIGALEILGEDPGTPGSHRTLLDSATKQAQRILRLATGLLEVERVDQGRLTLDRRDLPLVDLVDDIGTAQPALSLVVDVPPELSVWADPERLEQVLVNLTNNAARHGSPPLVVSAASDPSGVNISVRDHGAGVPEGDVPHLFERFTSADHSPQSVGLGLWIVRLLTEAHGGSVGYEPAEPGANFIVHLPHRSGTHEPAHGGSPGMPVSLPAQTVRLPD